MTKAYIDSASIHAALSALLIGTKRLSESPWEQQSLLEATYLLMHANVHIVPGLGHYGGPSGPYQHVLAQFPQLEELPPPDRRKAARLTKSWATKNASVLRGALEDLLEGNPVAQVYLNNSVECFWLDHVQMYGALFNREFIPQSARVLGCTQEELVKICDMTVDVKRVREWMRYGRRSEEAQLAERAYWLASLLRGRLHEHLAKASSLQLVAHPFRRAVQLELPEGPGKPVLRSEELFAKMIIGAALLERKPEHRVRSWIRAVRTARDAILIGDVALPPTVLDSQAEEYAIRAAKHLRVAGSSKLLARSIDVTLSVGFPVLIALTVSPWWLGSAGSVATQTYRYFAGSSVGDQLARVARSTRSHFRTLATFVPGRVERHLRAE